MTDIETELERYRPQLNHSWESLKLAFLACQETVHAQGELAQRWKELQHHLDYLRESAEVLHDQVAAFRVAIFDDPT